MSQATARVLVASNRGPLSFVAETDGSFTPRRGGGGLVSALSTLSGSDEALWVCAAMSEADRGASDAAHGRLDAGLPLRMLNIKAETFAEAYDGIANSVLWFVSHLLYPLATDPVFDETFTAQWESYRRVNAAFAEALAEDAAPGASVLVQDYHLSLVPTMLRALRPDLAIGHFSHTPWAPPDYFRVLPTEVARELLLGILGADRAGFLSSAGRMPSVPAASMCSGRTSTGRPCVSVTGRRSWPCTRSVSAQTIWPNGRAQTTYPSWTIRGCR